MQNKRDYIKALFPQGHLHRSPSPQRFKLVLLHNVANHRPPKAKQKCSELCNTENKQNFVYKQIWSLAGNTKENSHIPTAQKIIRISMETSHDFNDNNAVINVNNGNENRINLAQEGAMQKNNLNGIELTLYCPDASNNQHVRSVNTEEPMDLTFSQKQIKIEMGKSLKDTAQFLDKSHSTIANPEKATPLTMTKIIQASDQLIYSANVPKKRGRKRKDNSTKIGPTIKLSAPSYDNQDYLQAMDSRQAEVLMAAKSLFSKRTRTLYHWMYPNTPKAQLKSAVSLSWETLGVQEKEFYISQVLGRFGFPQSSLMVNPQLGGLRGIPVIPPLDLSSPTQINLETRNAVSTILENPEMQNEASCSWSQCNLLPHQMRKLSRKRGRIGRPPGKVAKVKPSGTVRPIAVENINEEFQDDPELRKEFEQFKWALHMSDKRN